MAEPASEIDRELSVFEAELKRLEAEYNMYFAGRLPRPPWETRSRVTDLAKRLDRAGIVNYAQRFRFSTIQARLATFIDLWDRGLRAKEEGKPGPLVHGRGASRVDRTLHVAALADPSAQVDTVRELYQRVVEARRELGQDSIPFQQFSELIRAQVHTFRQKGTPEVAFRVSMKDGKVAFTARALKRVPKSKG